MTRPILVPREELMNLEYNFIQRVMHWFFSTRSLFLYVGYYGLLNILVIIAGLTFIDVLDFNIEDFQREPSPESSPILISVQGGVLAVVSIALALVTIIAPKNNETSIIEIYYHESRAFEIISSSIALLGVLSIQTFAPIQTIAVLFDIENIILVLSVIPFLWLMVNLLGINHFIMTTLDFVNPDKRRMFRKRFTGNLVQIEKLENSSLPDPNRILNELVNKAVSKIDRNDLVEFRIVWEEMSDYHRFLLSLMVEQERNGISTEIHPYTQREIHVEWEMQYSQLFKRAVEKIPVEHTFIQILAKTPEYLLSASKASQFSDETIKDILDLIPALMRDMSEWAFKRSKFNKSCKNDMDLKLGVSLPPMEAGIYRETIFSVAEEWENLILNEAALYSSDFIEDNFKREWSGCKKSWSFLYRHLSNTASILTFAIVKRDNIVADHFQKILLEWESHIPVDLNCEYENMLFLSPEIMRKNWVDAEEQGKSILDSSSVEPVDIYRNIVSNAYQDTLFVISALLLYWLVEENRSSGVGYDVATNLLNELKYNHDVHDNHDLSLYILRFIIIGFNDSINYSDDSHDYSKSLQKVMRDFNYNKMGDYPDYKYHYDGLEPWDQITNAFVSMLLGKVCLKKDAVSRYTNEITKHNNDSIEAFIHCLKKIDSTLKDPSEFIHNLDVIDCRYTTDQKIKDITSRVDKVIGIDGYSSDPVEVFNRIRNSISERIHFLEKYVKI